MVGNKIPQQALNKYGIPEKPTMEIQSQKQTRQLGTKSARMDNCFKFAEQPREDLDSDVRTFSYEKMQHPRPEIGSNFIDAKTEPLWVFTEPDVTEKLIWYKEVVVAVEQGI